MKATLKEGPVKAKQDECMRTITKAQAQETGAAQLASLALDPSHDPILAVHLFLLLYS